MGEKTELSLPDDFNVPWHVTENVTLDSLTGMCLTNVNSLNHE